MRTIALALQKGGVGKTTGAVNIGAALAMQGHRTLVVDLDAQANATVWCNAEPMENGLADALWNAELPLEEIIAETPVDGLFVAPASLRYRDFELSLPSQAGAQLRLVNLLAEMQADWDYVLLDCPPNLGIMTTNALIAAHEVVVPLEATELGIRGLRELERTLELIRRHARNDVRVAAVYFAYYKANRNLSRDALAAVEQAYESRLLKTRIRENVRIAESFSARTPVVKFDPRSNGARDFVALAEEIDKLTENQNG